jgi:hypothetical protein
MFLTLYPWSNNKITLDIQGYVIPYMSQFTVYSIWFSDHWSTEFIRTSSISIGIICFSWDLLICPSKACCTDYWPSLRYPVTLPGALAAVKAFCLSTPRTPPDKATDSFQCSEGGYIACSSTINDILHVDSVYTESFDSEALVLIGLDSHCSRLLFPAKSDFISEIKPIAPFDVHGVGGTIKAIGQGTVRLRFRDSSGLLHDKLLVNAYYAPNVPVHLLSIPQLARDTNKRSNLCTGGTQSILTWDDFKVSLKHSTPSGDPFLWAYIGHPASTTLFNTHRSLYDCPTTDDHAFVTVTEEAMDNCVDHHDVTKHIDANIDHLRSLLHQPLQSTTQQDYAHWHHKLGHLPHTKLQDLVKQGKLPQRFRSCNPPICLACLFAKQTKRQWRYKGGKSHSLQDFATHHPGSLTFADQMISSTPGLIPQSTGHLTKCCYRAATVFVNSFSDYTHVSLQKDLSMDATLDAKLDYERQLSAFGVHVKGYHADNGRFAKDAWKDSCHILNQTFQYCGVGSHHQNGVVERRIRDLSNSARASLLHAIHYWPEGISKNLWPFALKYACNIRNRVRTSDGKTSEKLISGCPSSFTTDFSQYHPFGCPAYVLDAQLQGGSKIPRWKSLSRIGINLGHTPHHTKNVALILNLSTGHVFPQYHVVYDDCFTTVNSIKVDAIPSNWAELCSNNCELVTDENFTLSPEWTDNRPEQSSIHWLESHLDSEPMTVDNVFPMIFHHL